MQVLNICLMYKILCNYILHIFQMNKKICKILEIIAYKLAPLLPYFLLLMYC